MAFVDVSDLPSFEVVELSLADVSAAMCAYFRAQRAVKGDRFATELEMEFLLDDPWGWVGLARPMFDLMFLGADVRDYDLSPAHSEGVLYVYIKRNT